MRQLRHVVVGVLSVVVVAGLGASSVGANAPEATGEFIVVLKPGANRASAVAAARSAGGEVLFEYRHALDGFAVNLPAAAVAGIERNPNVLFVSESREFRAAAAPTPTENPQVLQRSVDRIDAEESSARSGDGRGAVAVNVAVLDSGIDSDHPDLNVAGGFNCLNDKNGIEDTYFHGTLVAGSIAARDNDIGFVGVAPGASLYAVKVIRHNSTTNTATVLCGIDWVTSTRTDADPRNDIAVANMSLGGGDNKVDGACGIDAADPLHLALCRSIDSGVTYVVSAMNASDDIAQWEPASYDEVLTVTAMNDTDGLPGSLGGPEVRCGLGYADDTAADFSNFATSAADLAHTVAAPGVCVPSTFPGGLYGRDSGTSFAAPLVAGTVALCIASGPCAGLSPAQIVQKIVADAAAANGGDKGAGYGFLGDPLRPVPGKSYGYLIQAAGY